MGHKFHASVSRFEDGKLAELFLNTGKAGTDTQLFMRDASIILSLALQYGADPANIRKSLTRNANGSAASALGKVLDMLEKEKRHDNALPQQSVASDAHSSGNQ